MHSCAEDGLSLLRSVPDCSFSAWLFLQCLASNPPAGSWSWQDLAQPLRRCASQLASLALLRCVCLGACTPELGCGCQGPWPSIINHQFSSRVHVTEPGALPA